MNAVISGTVTLVIEPHAFLASYLRDVLAGSGHAVVAVSRPGSRLALRRLRPDAVVIGLGATKRRPLEIVDTIRRACPQARIVVLSEQRDAAWDAVVRALGAGAVLGSDADATSLVAALNGEWARQENDDGCRTSYADISQKKSSPSLSYPR